MTWDELKFTAEDFLESLKNAGVPWRQAECDADNFADLANALLLEKLGRARIVAKDTDGAWFETKLPKTLHGEIPPGFAVLVEKIGGENE